MSLPYVVSEAVWSAKAVTETVGLKSEFERCQVTVIEIATTGFSGTIDIQGKLYELGAFANVPYIRQDQASIQTPSVSQISLTTDTDTYRYVILGYWRKLEIVMTRTAGSITCGVAGSSDANIFPFILSEAQVDIVSGAAEAITIIRHPFGKGSLTTNGVQYCTAVTGIDNDAYDAVESITIQQPTGMTLVEIEFGLTGRLDVSGTPTDSALWKWQASDAGSSWQDLIAEQTLATPAAATDVTCAGRFAPTGNFLGAGSSFQVRMVAKSSGATDTVTAETKNSSYIVCRYRRT